MSKILKLYEQKWDYCGNDKLHSHWETHKMYIWVDCQMFEHADWNWEKLGSIEHWFRKYISIYVQIEQMKEMLGFYKINLKNAVEFKKIEEYSIKLADLLANYQGRIIDEGIWILNKFEEKIDKLKKEYESSEEYLKWHKMIDNIKVCEFIKSSEVLSEVTLDSVFNSSWLNQSHEYNKNSNTYFYNYAFSNEHCYSYKYSELVNNGSSIPKEDLFGISQCKQNKVNRKFDEEIIKHTNRDIIKRLKQKEDEIKRLTMKFETDLSQTKKSEENKYKKQFEEKMNKVMNEAELKVDQMQKELEFTHNYNSREKLDLKKQIDSLKCQLASPTLPTPHPTITFSLSPPCSLSSIMEPLSSLLPQCPSIHISNFTVSPTCLLQLLECSPPSSTLNLPSNTIDFSSPSPALKDTQIKWLILTDVATENTKEEIQAFVKELTGGKFEESLESVQVGGGEVGVWLTQAMQEKFGEKVKIKQEVE
jgi:hypothetical protein